MFNTNEQIKKLNSEKTDLQMRIDNLELENKLLNSKLDISTESNRYNQDLLDVYKEDNEEAYARNMELEDQTALIKYQTEKIHVLDGKVEELLLEIEELNDKLKESIKLKERFETQNIILKETNEQLSDVNLKVQPILDENIKLHSVVETLNQKVFMRDEVITDLRKQ